LADALESRRRRSSSLPDDGRPSLSWAIVRRVELTRTGRLLLRRWEEDDLPAFFDLYSRDDVMRWLGPQPRRALASPDEARAGLRRWHAREQGLELPMGFWAIVPLVLPRPAGPQAPVGTIALLPLADADGPTGLTEVAWHLHPDHQGRGLATEAAGAALAVATSAAGVGPVLALTDLDNVRSQAVAARLGMRDEGLTQRWFGLTMRQFRYPA
jgi:RimJ/RimL family protein N-acetyltransferase